MLNPNWFQVLQVLLTVGVVSAAGVFALAVIDNERLYLFLINDIGHLVVLLSSLFLFLPHLEAGRPPVPREPNNPADIAAKQFLNWLYALNVVWILLYLARFFVDVSALTTKGAALAARAEAASPYLNVATAVPFVGMYMVLARRGMESRGWAGRSIWVMTGFISIVAAGQQWAASQPSEKEIALVAGIANGFLVGVSQALLIGKLDSVFIRLSTPVVVTLFLYSLLQPLFPYVFEPTNDPLRTALQQVFVAIALIMKIVLILTIGRLIDTWRLHFYLSNVRWLDRHAATLIAQHEILRTRAMRSQATPPIFAFVRPEHLGAKVRIERLDVQLSVNLVNLWLGIEWDIREVHVQTVVISETELDVRVVRLAKESIRLEDGNRHTPVELLLDTGLDRQQLIERLLGDPRVASAINSSDDFLSADVAIKGLKGKAALLERDGLDHQWLPIEPVDGSDRLTYKCNLNLVSLREEARRLLSAPMQSMPEGSL